MREADLRDLGIHRIPVPIPFPEAGGPVNAYAMLDEGGGFTLFDAGLGSREAEAALDAGLAAAGLRHAELNRIVVSHGHVDHYGGALTAVEKAGRPVEVLAHARDTPKIAESGPRWKDLLPAYGAYFLRLGVPAETLLTASTTMGSSFKLARRLPSVRTIAPGEVLRFARFSAEVLHMPGHTPGLLCLWDPVHRIFFSDDHLLEKVSPNPIIELGPDGREGVWKPLVAYLESAGRMHELDVELVLPGHGPAFGDHRRVIDGLVRFYAQRQAKIRAALAGGPRTAYEVLEMLFPWASPRQLFLVISETIANIEVLEARGEVRRELSDGVYRFALA